MSVIEKSVGLAVLAAGVFVAAASAASAEDTQAAWVGLMENTASTSACAGVGGAGVSDRQISVYRPHILAADTPTYLSVVHLAAAFTLQNSSESTNHQMNGNGKDEAIIINPRAQPGMFAGSYSKFVITPSPVKESTQVVTITGKINDYFNHTGCDVTFKAAYTKE